MTSQDGIHGFHIGSEYAVAYHYDNAGTGGQLTGTGRFKRITGPGLDGTYGAVYFRLVENGVNTSDLVEYPYFKSSSDATLATIHRKYDGNRDLVDFVENLAGSTTVCRYDYTNDTLGRRTNVIRTGKAVDSTPPYDDTGFTEDFGYNTRSELEATDRFLWAGSKGPEGSEAIFRFLRSLFWPSDGVQAAFEPQFHCRLRDARVVSVGLAATHALTQPLKLAIMLFTCNGTKHTPQLIGGQAVYAIFLELARDRTSCPGSIS